MGGFGAVLRAVGGCGVQLRAIHERRALLIRLSHVQHDVEQKVPIPQGDHQDRLSANGLLGNHSFL